MLCKNINLKDFKSILAISKNGDFYFLMFGQDFTHPRSWCIMKEKISFILLERIRNFLTFLLLLSFSFRIKTINSPVSISFFFPFCFLFAKHVGISGNLISKLLIAGCCLLSSRCFLSRSHIFLFSSDSIYIVFTPYD